MKAYHIDRFGSVGGIVRRSSEDPRPGPKEILIRVCSSSLNYRDLMVLRGGGRGPPERLDLRRADMQPDNLASAIGVGGKNGCRS